MTKLTPLVRCAGRPGSALANNYSRTTGQGESDNVRLTEWSVAIEMRSVQGSTY